MSDTPSRRSPPVFEVGGWTAMRSHPSPTPEMDDTSAEPDEPSLKRKAKLSLSARRPAKTPRVSLGSSSHSSSITRSGPPAVPQQRSLGSIFGITRRSDKGTRPIVKPSLQTRHSIASSSRSLSNNHSSTRSNGGSKANKGPQPKTEATHSSQKREIDQRHGVNTNKPSNAWEHNKNNDKGQTKKNNRVAVSEADEDVIQISSDSEVAEHLASDTSRRFSNLTMNEEGVCDLTLDETSSECEDETAQTGESKAKGGSKGEKIVNQILLPSDTTLNSERPVSGAHIARQGSPDPKPSSEFRVSTQIPSNASESSSAKSRSSKVNKTGSGEQDRSLSDTICISLGGVPAAMPPTSPHNLLKRTIATKSKTNKIQGNTKKAAPMPAVEVIDLCTEDEDEEVGSKTTAPILTQSNESPGSSNKGKSRMDLSPSLPRSSSDRQLNGSNLIVPGTSESIEKSKSKPEASNNVNFGGRRDLQLVAAALRKADTLTKLSMPSSRPCPSTPSDSGRTNETSTVPVIVPQRPRNGLSSSNPLSPKQRQKPVQNTDNGGTLSKHQKSDDLDSSNNAREINTFEAMDININEVQDIQDDIMMIGKVPQEGESSHDQKAIPSKEVPPHSPTAITEISLAVASSEKPDHSVPGSREVTPSVIPVNDIDNVDRSSHSKTPEIRDPITPNTPSGRRIGTIKKPDFSQLQIPDVIPDNPFEVSRSLGAVIKWPAEKVPTELHDMINRLPKNYLFNPQMKHIFESMIEENTADDEPTAPRIEIRGRRDDQVTPFWEFYYTNRIFRGQGVPRSKRETLKGCDCIGPCDPKSKTCACVKRQMAWVGGDKNIKGFLYNKHGRLVEHHYPVFECNDECECSENCMNRVVQHGRKHAISITLTTNKGWGVFADEKIPRGTYLGIYAGEMILESEADERGKLYDKFGRTYLFDMDFYYLHSLADDKQKTSGVDASSNTSEDEVLANTYTVDAFHVGNFTRFLNHSCDPNCKITATYVNEPDVYKPTLTIYTCRDVRAGEELTFAYFGADEDDVEEEEIDEHGQKKVKVVGGPLTHHKNQAVYTPCLCGSVNCRGQMF